MKSALTENEIEQYQLQRLQTLGHSYCNSYNIQPDGRNKEGESFDEVVLKEQSGVLNG